MSPTKPRGVNNIPERYRPGLLAVVGLSDASFVELASALERAPAFANAKELTAWIFPEAKSIPAADIEKIAESLTALYRVRLRLEVPPERMGRDVVSALRFDGQGDQITNGNVDAAASRIAKLLGMESLNILETKIEELKSEYEHGFCDARIFTDVRPVFGGDVADSPGTMLLVYMLKLGYHDAHEGRHREFYVSLDTRDLESLKAAIVRAEKKARSIKTRFESAGLKVVDTV